MSTDSTSVSPGKLAGVPEFYNPIVSPDGDEVALYYHETGRNELYVLDRATGEHDPWTDGEAPRNARWHLLWGPDGDRVYFHRDEEGDEQNDVAAVDRDGTVQTVVDVDGQALLSEVSGDGRYLLYCSDEGEQMNAYRYDVETGAREQLTAFDQPVLSARFSPADDRIAFGGNESSTLKNRDVYVMAADGSDRRRLDVGEDGSETKVATWFPDGERLLVADDAADRRRVGVYDFERDEVEWLSDGTAQEHAQDVSPDGRYVLASRDRRGATMPVVYDLETGESNELDLPEGVVSFPKTDGGPFADETTLVFAHSTSDQREQLYEYDLETDERRVVLPAEYGDVDPDVFVDSEYLTYESGEFEIGALLYDPRDGPAMPDDAEDVSGIVLVHSGPHRRAKKTFKIHTQFLVSQGYAVLAPNFRGSTGRGREFKQAVLGDWGGAEQEDIARGGRWLMDRDWIDEDRIGVIGGSYGGYSACMQLVSYPDVWATGVTWNGITDLHALYEEDMPHFRHSLRMQMGDPEENYDRWRERSPIEHVEDLQDPLLILHGVNDARCPVSQARLFRDALEDHGLAAGEDFEYVELDEGHGSTDQGQKQRAFELLADYFDRRL